METQEKIVNRYVEKPVKTKNGFPMLALILLLFFGSIDLQHRKIFNNTKTAVLFENLLELGTSDQIILADLVNGYMCCQMTFQIIHNTAKNLGITVTFRNFRRISLRKFF